MRCMTLDNITFDKWDTLKDYHTMESSYLWFENEKSWCDKQLLEQLNQRANVYLISSLKDISNTTVIPPNLKQRTRYETEACVWRIVSLKKYEHFYRP